jgi:hypothetical protein
MSVDNNNKGVMARRVAALVAQTLRNKGVGCKKTSRGKDPGGKELHRVFDVLAFEKGKAPLKNRRAGEAVIGWLMAHGEIYVDRDNLTPEGLYWLDKRYTEAQLRTVCDHEFNSLLAGKCGRNVADKPFQAARDWLVTSALDPESKTAQRAEMALSWVTRGSGKQTVCYLSKGSSLVRCSADGARVVPMGTDNVLIPREACLPDWNLTDSSESWNSPDELPFIACSGLSRNEQIVFGLYLTILCLMRPGEVPPLALEGAPQSGKTTALVEAGRLFYGDVFRAIDPNGKDAEAAIPRMLSLFKFLVWDNLDNEHNLRGFVDRLAASTTGASSMEKTHYVNGKVTVLPVHAAQCLSAVNTDFLTRHPTLASRLINLVWATPRTDFNLQFVRDQTRAKRSSTLSFIAHTMSKAISEFDPEEKVTFRFDCWQRFYNSCARVLLCEDIAKEAFLDVMKRSQERGLVADKYGAALLSALQPGESLTGVSGDIFDRIKHYLPPDEKFSSYELSAWLRNMTAHVARGISVKITGRDNHLKQHIFTVSRNAE